MALGGEECDLVVPISLYRIGDQLHNVLRGYKDSPSAVVRERHSLLVAALLDRFLSAHRGCIHRAAGRDWDAVTSVPSSRERQGTHPLVSAIAKVPWLHREYLEDSLGAAPGGAAHNNASADDFGASAAVKGRSMLLIEDSFVSGAKVQSAAAALRREGARVVAIVTVGRVINDNFLQAEYVAEVGGMQPFSFDDCCIHTSPIPGRAGSGGRY